MWRNTYSGFLILAFIVSACSNEEPKREPKWTRVESTKLNKAIAEEEKVDIQLFIERQGTPFITTGSGLNYSFIYDSIGEPIKSGRLAFVEFEMKTLEGETLYASQEGELQEFRVDRSNIETGVQEAIKYMSLGDHCRIIVPSHLGHGLTGDHDKIPPFTPLVIDLKLKEIR